MIQGSGSAYLLSPFFPRRRPARLSRIAPAGNASIPLLQDGSFASRDSASSLLA
jgi:hypothetical protein